ncbi:MAG: hypothetical protein II826_10560 [Prevotella sp.]|nr:hypothetical protein [Prevotella sp.]
MTKLLLTAFLAWGGITAATAGSRWQTPAEQMERLDRGIVVTPGQNGGRFVSWRLLGTDHKDVTFDVVRNGTVIASRLASATSYQDNGGQASDSYAVVARLDGEVLETAAAVHAWSDMYVSITLDRPAAGSNYQYTPNDMSVGDVDGDGQYELFVKWDPSNSKDNANTGHSAACLIDCYRLDGTKLWRVNLGANIRAGAHYTQFMVYDFDGDGRAEMMCKTAPGSLDGKGAYVSAAADDATIKATDNAASYDNGGRILSGPEFLTVFDGLTGGARHTIWYNPNRAGNYGKAENYPSNSSFWGDTNGNRGDRHLAAVAHLDKGARTASGIFCRGYYTRAYVWAVDYSGGKLRHRWLHCSSSKTAYSVTDAHFSTSSYTNASSTSGEGSATMYANGNHNISIADVDADGKDEIIWGSAACDDNGHLLYGVGFGHGDAMHLADLIPDRPGLEVFDVHENKGTYAWDVHDAATGEVLLKGGPSGVDNGRGLAAQVSPDHRESFFSSAADNQTRSCATGAVVSEYGPLINNFRIFWDGDLQEELLGDISNHNHPILEKWNGNGYSRMYPKRNTNLYSIGNSASCNGTKGTPCLQADILGDWREEMIFYDETDPSKINIFTTNVPTGYRVPTLMHDHVYRMGVAWQNVAYNQPPHLGFYLPDYIASLMGGDDSGEGAATEGAVVYEQDYEQQKDATAWRFVGVQRGDLTLQTGDAAQGQYIQFSLPASVNSTAVYSLATSGGLDSYVLTFDLALTAGNRDGSQFVVMTEGGNYNVPSGSPQWFSYAAHNNNLHSLLFIDIPANGSAVALNYDGANVAELATGGWLTYRLKVDGQKRTVDYTVTPKGGKSVVAKGTYTLPAGTTSTRLQGFYYLAGRYYGSMKIDNVKVTEMPVEPVTVYEQDYEQQKDAAAWAFTNGVTRGDLTLQTGDAAQGQYIQFSLPGGVNSTPVYTLVSSGDNDSYQLSFDLALKAGSKDGSQFVVMTQGGKYQVPQSNYWFSYAGYNANLHSLLFIDIPANGSAAAINYDSTDLADLATDAWQHYLLKVDGEKRTVDYTITQKSTGGIVKKGTYTLPAGTTSTRLQGFYYLAGRYYGAMRIDNIRITVDPAPQQPQPLPGDVNDDGSVDKSDLATILSVIANKEKAQQADINGDGVANIADILTLIGILVGR